MSSLIILVLLVPVLLAALVFLVTRRRTADARRALMEGSGSSPFRSELRARARLRIDKANAELEKGALGEDQWAADVTDALATAYLADEDPRWESGFDGDARSWREGRELILDPVTRDGTFLDTGCANGHLMECLEAWGRERGRRLEVYGLELHPRLLARARERLPQLAARIFHGNVSTWNPPRLFTYVHTGLEYVPPRRRAALIRRVVDQFLEPGGRLITRPMKEADLAEQQSRFREAGLEYQSIERTDSSGVRRYVLWCERNA